MVVAHDREEAIGTAKRRSPQPIPPQELYAQIDSMPMRQREMRQRSGSAP